MLTACRGLLILSMKGWMSHPKFAPLLQQNLGDTLLLWDDGALAGFAVCHCGTGSEAGGGTCYIKFGVVRSGPWAARDFNMLLSLRTMAARKGLARLVAGCNLGARRRYGCMRKHGFAQTQGVAMQRHNHPGPPRRIPDR